MATKVIWSQEALGDVDAIAAYISRDSPYHANRVVEELFTLMNASASHPKMGRIVPELGDPRIRERFLYSYRIIYEQRKADLLVLAVIHGRRLLESIEDRFPSPL